MSVITAEPDRDRAVAELRRAAPRGARREHHAGLRPRHQRDEPRRHRHARHRPARAARRPQPVSGLLRLRHVGLPAGQPERDQADRSDPRAGVGGLGRQRAQRRRQRDHQVAARDAGHERRARLRHVRPRPDGEDCRLAVVRERHARGGDQRSLGVQALGRRLLAGRALAADRRDPLRRSATSAAGTRGVIPGVRRTRARRSRSSTRASTTTSRTDASCRSRAASPAPTASCTPASARSTSTAAR